MARAAVRRSRERVEIQSEPIRCVKEYWTPEPLWAGETCFILGGGPGLRDVNLTKLRGRRVMTINSSLAPAAAAGLDDGALFFTDADWFNARREAIAAWRGPVISPSSFAKKEMRDRVKRVLGEFRGDFPKPGAPVIRKGKSSGQTGIGLAVALGAVRIVLLGFDMRFVDGRSHHHDEYRCADTILYRHRFVPAFKGWRAGGLAVGVDIVNATPDSALTEFPFVDLAEVLRCAPS